MLLLGELRLGGLNPRSHPRNLMLLLGERRSAWPWLHAPESCRSAANCRCGTGRITLALLRAGLEVEGLDFSTGLLARFRQPPDALQALLEASGFRVDHRLGDDNGTRSDAAVSPICLHGCHAH